METLIDMFELHAMIDRPVVETYRDRASTPRDSVDLSVDYEDSLTRIPTPAVSSERWLRARLWSSEE